MLNEHLRRFAEQHRRKGVSAVYVLADSAAPTVILGYYTFRAADLPVLRTTGHFYATVEARQGATLGRTRALLHRRPGTWPAVLWQVVE